MQKLAHTIKSSVLLLTVIASQQLYAQDVNVTSPPGTVTTVSTVLHNQTDETKEVKEKKLGLYEVNKDDYSMTNVVKRWASQSDLVVYWDADTDWRISNVNNLNKQLLKSGINQDTSLHAAISKALKIMSYNTKTETPLKVCSFNKDDDSIIIRPVTLPCN